MNKEALDLHIQAFRLAEELSLEKARAGSIAGAAPGVTRVVNEIAVRDA